MHDPNFEETVQQKMEELQFHPAESVWVNIEKAVAGQRHRRGLPVFWRFALPFFVAVAATGVYFIARPTGKPASVRDISKQSVAGSLTVSETDPAANATVSAPVSNGSVAGTKASATPGSLGTSLAASEGKAGMSGSANLAGNNRRARLNLTGTDGAARNQASLHRTGNGRTGNSRADNGRAGTNDPARFADASKGFAGRQDGDSHQPGAGSSSKTGVLSDRDEAAQGVEPAVGTGRMNVAPAQETRKAWLFQPELADQRRMQAIRAAQLNNKKASIAIAGLQKKSRPWEAGFVAGGGISRLNRLNASQAAAAVSTIAISFYNINGSNLGKAYISDVRSDASFSGGIYLQKAISDRLTFNTGMMLHYYSSGITIGQQVNTYTQPSASFVNPAALATAPSAAVYSAGNQRSFTNRYYFLELPLNIQWQVNKSHLLPLFLEGGFSLARVMGANALLYDSETGVYSKQGEQINKTQLYVSTAFMVGLPIHGLHIEVGPQVQYGLTPIVNNQSLGDQHFFYAGLKVVIIPGKK